MKGDHLMIECQSYRIALKAQPVLSVKCITLIHLCVMKLLSFQMFL